MRYIPGTSFVVGQVATPQQQFKRSRSVLQQHPIRPQMDQGKFKLSNQYLLKQIRPKDNDFEYHFVNQTTGESFVEKFSSTNIADKALDRFLGVV